MMLNSALESIQRRALNRPAGAEDGAGALPPPFHHGGARGAGAPNGSETPFDDDDDDDDEDDDALKARMVVSNSPAGVAPRGLGVGGGARGSPAELVSASSAGSTAPA